MNSMKIELKKCIYLKYLIFLKKIKKHNQFNKMYQIHHLKLMMMKTLIQMPKISLYVNKDKWPIKIFYYSYYYYLLN